MGKENYCLHEIHYFLLLFHMSHNMVVSSLLLSVRIRDEALLAAAKLSSRYLPDRFLPDKG